MEFDQFVEGGVLNQFILCNNYLPRRRRPGTGDIATPPSVRPSVHLSVTFSFCTVTQKRIAVFSRNFATPVRAPFHGGVLYSF